MAPQVEYMDGTLIHNPMVCQFMLKEILLLGMTIDLTSNSYGVNLSGYNTVRYNVSDRGMMMCKRSSRGC
jgi:hypothetical protein